MTTVGPNNPSSASSYNGIGASAWNNPGNVYTLDGSYADYDSDVGDSEGLDVTGFGFSIPAGATINGIQFDISKKRGISGASIKDVLIKALQAGSAVGTSQADTSTNWPVNFTYVSYGGASSLWGASWTNSDVNASGFGIRIQGSQDGNSRNTTGRVDHVRCTITYTAGASGGLFTVSSLAGLGCSGPKNFNRLERRKVIDAGLWIPKRPSILVPALITGA